MNKNAIQKYAVWARNELIEQIQQRAYQYSINDKGYGDENATVIAGRVLSTDEKRQRTAFVHEIQKHGYQQAVEEVAYTWFNRFVALRYMEVNDYLPTHVRVFSDASGSFNPEILKDVLHLELEGLDKSKVSEMLNANLTEELYRYLLLTQCNALNAALPEMFEKLGSYTEMLLPNNILKPDSILGRLVKDIDEDDWKDAVQIIGWMYQYYNTEPKQAVFDALKKNVKITKEKIPAATQLFTPDWIVRYMVENSLGRLWLESHPNPTLKANWKYYLDEAEQTPEVAEKLRVIRSQSLVKSPEDIRLIDPSMGSGHILVYAFDVLMQIYESEGFNPRDAAKLILEKNIYGLDIDRRAYQLAYFSLMMKARQYNRRIFTDGVKPQVYHPVGFPDGEEYGSLLKVDELPTKPEEPKEITLFTEDYETTLNAWNFKRLLAQKYHVVCTNPPYMGATNMSVILTDYIKTNYNESKTDLYSCFIKKCCDFCIANGFVAMITMESWMFLSKFKKFRQLLLNAISITSLIHMPYDGQGKTSLGISFGTSAFSFRKGQLNYNGQYMCIRYYENDEDGNPINYPTVNERFNTAHMDDFYVTDDLTISYWISSRMRELFAEGNTLSNFAEPRQGLATSDNDRYLRLWYEVDWNRESFDTQSREEAINCGKKWFALTKGGEFRKWYGNNFYVVDWENDGADMKAAVMQKYPYLNTPDFVVKNQKYYFRPGITWSTLTSSKISFRNCESGFIMETKGSICYPMNPRMQMYIIAFLNSTVCEKFAEILSPTMDLHEGPVGRLPFVYNPEFEDRINEIASRNIDLCKLDWDAREISWNFIRFPLIKGSSIKSAYEIWSEICESRHNELKNNEESINRLFAKIYALQDETVVGVEDKYVSIGQSDLKTMICEFISYAVGCMFGRYSLDVDGLVYAGGDWDNDKYITFIPDSDNIIPICDDEYFDDDILGRFTDFVRVVYGAETLEENLKYIADAIGGNGTPREVIRNYFLNDFYKDHCKIYQKRPIYWLFDSGKKNGFKSLVYLHRYKSDLLAKLRTDYVHEQQERYRTQLSHISTALNTASGSERARLLKQQDKLSEQLKEITAFEEKVHHLADQNIKIDLDDGVKKNYEIFTDVLAKI